MAEVNLKQVLVLMKDGATRQSFAKALTASGFKVDFCSSMNDALELLNALSAGILIHDFEAFDKTQATQFQQRFARLDTYNSLIRILYAQEITPKVLALANDAQIRRIVGYTTKPEVMAEEIKMLTKTGNATNELQRRIRELATQGPSKAHEIDELIEQAYTTYKHDPQIRVEFAGTCVRRSQLEEAKNIVSDVLRGDATNVRAMSILSRVLMKQGKMEEAIQVMEKANGLSPSNPERLIALGDAFFQKGDKEKAKGFFSEAASVAPDAAVAANKGLAQIALSEGDATAAVDLLVNCCTEEESAGFFNNAAVAAKRAGHNEKALQLYESAMKSLKTNKLRPLIFFNIALVYYDTKNYEQAAKAIKQALRIDKKYEKALRLQEKINKEYKETA